MKPLTEMRRLLSAPAARRAISTAINPTRFNPTRRLLHTPPMPAGFTPPGRVGAKTMRVFKPGIEFPVDSGDLTLCTFFVLRVGTAEDPDRRYLAIHIHPDDDLGDLIRNAMSHIRAANLEEKPRTVVAIRESIDCRITGNIAVDLAANLQTKPALLKDVTAPAQGVSATVRTCVFFLPQSGDPNVPRNKGMFERLTDVIFGSNNSK
ncbi:hypothetical protein KWH39_19435 [Xanthomonas campestris pv. obscurae]|nr:hypothetical protein [Xanthomonas campestris pv. obscurae]